MSAVDPVTRLRAGDRSRATLRDALHLRGEDQAALWGLAREVRAAAFPAGQVEVRSVVEVGNTCIQTCRFCTIPAAARDSAFLLDPTAIVEIVDQLYARGRRVVMLQAGEIRSQKFVRTVTEASAGIKAKHPDLDLILCVGSLPRAAYAGFRAAGADRFILKFEASRPTLYQQIKPSETIEARLRCLDDLVDLGFDVGTGNITGLPGQVAEDLVDDLLLLHARAANLTMGSTALFIPSPGSVYEAEAMGDVDDALNFTALLRVLGPHLLIPSTSSLERPRPGGQLQGLLAGANTVTVHDGTPDENREQFPIYSSQRYTPSEERLYAAVAQAGLSLPLSASPSSDAR